MKSETNSPTQEMRALYAACGLGLALVIVSLPWMGVFFAASVFAGALTGAVNLWLLIRTVRALFARVSIKSWVLLGVLKWGLLFLSLYGLFSRGLVAEVPFLLGIATMPLGIILSPLFRPSEDESQASGSSTPEQTVTQESRHA